MAKSMRSKVKRSFRSKKRETGIYAVTEAARLHRLNSKLMSLVSNNHAEGASVGEEKESPDVDNAIEPPGQADEMDLDTNTDTNTAVTVDKAKRISTHGPRGSRRETWRMAKGLGSRAKGKARSKTKY